MAFTTLYLSADAPRVAPATIRGAFDGTTDAVTMAVMQTTASQALTTSISVPSLGLDQRVLLYRGVSTPLAAQTLSGTLQLTGVVGGGGSIDAVTIRGYNWHLHVYVMVGDTDVVRGTLIDNYQEPLGTNEWSVGPTGQALNAPVALTPVDIEAGDRIVCEIGFVDHYGAPTMYNGTFRFGFLRRNYAIGVLLAAAVVGEPHGTTTEILNPGIPFITFSESIAELDVPISVSQTVVETMTAQPAPAVRLGQVVVETVTKCGTEWAIDLSQMVIEIITKPWPDNDEVVDGSGGIVFGGAGTLYRIYVPPAVLCRVWPIGHLKFPCPDEGEVRSPCLSPEQELQNDMD